MAQLYSIVWCKLISKTNWNNLKIWRADLFTVNKQNDKSGNLFTVNKQNDKSGNCPTTKSFFKSINNHYIVLIGALKKELKAEDNWLLKNSWKKAFLLWHHQCFLRSAVKGKMSDNLSNHYKMSDPSFQCIISFWKIFLDK